MLYMEEVSRLYDKNCYFCVPHPLGAEFNRVSGSDCVYTISGFIINKDGELKIRLSDNSGGFTVSEGELNESYNRIE